MTPKQLEKHIAVLRKQFGCCKVILTDGKESEGVWAVPTSRQARTKIDNDNSTGETVKVHLCNTPLMLPLAWGSLVKAKTRGSLCPVITVKSTEPS